MRFKPVLLENPLEAVALHSDAFGIAASEAGLGIDALSTDGGHLELSRARSGLLELPDLQQHVLHEHSSPLKFLFHRDQSLLHVAKVVFLSKTEHFGSKRHQLLINGFA